MTIAFSGFSIDQRVLADPGAGGRGSSAEELGVEFINLTTEVQDAEAQKAAVDTAITQGAGVHHRWRG